MNLNSPDFWQLVSDMPPASSRTLVSDFEGYLGTLGWRGQVQALSGASQSQVDQVWGVLKPRAKQAILAQQWEEFVAKETP